MRSLIFLTLFLLSVKLILSVPLSDPDASPDASPDADPDASPDTDPDADPAFPRNRGRNNFVRRPVASPRPRTGRRYECSPKARSRGLAFRA
jgi:hypothetical protein